MKNHSTPRRDSARLLRPRPLTAGIAALLIAAGSASAQTFTAPTNGTFTTPLVWNFGAGPVPASSAALALTLQNFALTGGTFTAANDLNLTLNRLDLANFSGGTFALTSTLGGDYAFTGGAGVIGNLGSDLTTVLSAPVVFGQGLTSLTFDGAGAAGLTVSGIVSSNTGVGAPLVISTDAGNAGTGVVTLSGANTFSGGVRLDSGTFSVGNTRALGARTNVLTINGGSLRSSATTSIANDVALNADLKFNGVQVLALTGVLSGPGGVTSSAGSGTTSVLGLGGINTFTGAIVVRGRDFAAAALDSAGSISIDGAAGSVLNTAGIDVSEGGAFRLNYSAGNSVVNTRVAAGIGIGVTSSFLEIFGNAGIVRQTIGSVNAGGLTTIFASTTGAATSGTEITINNFNRVPAGTVTFSGPNLGGAAVAPGLAAAQGNIIAPSLGGALTGGGGGTGTTTISIVPWALGDSANTPQNYAAGSGFVTCDANGVRLLNAATEYNTSNNFNTGGGPINMRITGPVTNPATGTVVNSIFFAATGQTLGAPNPIVISSGALASNVAAATVTAPLHLGSEGIVSVIGLRNTTNVLTLSGNVTASSLVKSGHGRLVLSGAANAIPNLITIDGGQIEVSAISRLGGAASLTFNGHSDAANRAELRYTGAGANTLTAFVTTNSGMAGFNVTNAAGALNLSSSITGAGGVRKDGGGTLVLSGLNTYRGGTYLGGGTLEIDSDARLGDATDPAANFLALSAGAGATLRLSGNWISARAISVDATATLHTQANSATLSGAITGTGGLAKYGAGTLFITGADNGFSGQISIGGGTLAEGGTVAISGAGALNSANVTFGGSLAPPGTYLLDLSGATAPSGTPWRSFRGLGSGTTLPHEVRLGAASFAPVDLRLASGSFGSAAGVISGFGKLVKVGGGASPLTLDGITANTFVGGVEIWGGTLAFGADNQLGDFSNGITIQGGILNNTANVTTSRGVTLGATPQPVVRAAGAVQSLVNGITANAGTALTLNGTIGGAGGYEKSGAGAVTLGSFANSYQGDTQISAGTLFFADDAQLGAASSRLRMNGGTLQFYNNTAAALPRTILLTTNSVLSTGVNGGTLDVRGPIVGGNTLFRFGANSMTISGNSPSFFGTLNIGDGTNPTGSVTLASTGQLRGATVSVTANSAATFDMSGLTREFGALNIGAGTLVNIGSGRVTAGFNNGAMTWADGGIAGAVGSSFAKVGAGPLAISGVSSLQDGFQLLSGTGTTTVSGNGMFALVNAFTIGAWGDSANRGPVLHLDNTGTNNTFRIPDSQGIDSNSGELQFSSNAGVASFEFAASLRGAGMSIVTMTTGGTLSFNDAFNGLTRGQNSTFLFRAGSGNLGSGVATTTTPNLVFANPLALIGGGGPAGSTTISILPYAMGGVSTTDAGISFVTHGASGIRPLNTATENNANLIIAGPTENVRLNNGTLTTTTLSGADKTVNSLVLAGADNTTRIESVAGERLILESGALLSAAGNVFAINSAGTEGVPLGIQAAQLQTGAGNSRELNVFAVGDLAIGTTVTTSGGLTKSGAGALYLTNAANSYTGITTVNAGSLVIDNLAALGNSAQLQLGGGFFKYRGGDATLANHPVIATNAGFSVGGSAGIHVVSGTTLTVPNTSFVSGFGGVLKDGTGVLALPLSTNTGATLIAAGALAISDPVGLGINQRVVFTNSAISAAGGQTLRFDAPMALTQDFITNTAQPGVGFGFDTNGNDVTLSGTILSSTSTRGLYKFGAGELNLTATEMFTGATQVFGGTLRLSGADGSILNSTGTGGFDSAATVSVNSAATLLLDNAAANNNNRLPDVWDTPFGTSDGASGKLRVNGGELKIIGNAAGTHERINQFDISAGTITLSGGGTTVESGQFRRAFANSTGLIRGTNLGGTPGLGSTNWFVQSLGAGGVQLGGAGGAEGTPFINILSGFMGDTSATGVGTGLLTYAADTGFRLLTAGEYTTAIPVGNLDLNRAPNVILSGSTQVNQTTAITALRLNGPGTTVSGSGTLILAQSTVLVEANTSATINVSSLSTNIAGGNTGYNFLTPGAVTTLTIASTLPSAGLWKYGAGTLRLEGRYAGGSFVDVAQGKLVLGSSGALNPMQNVFVHRNATLDLGGGDRTIGSLSTTSAIGAFNMGQVLDGAVLLGLNRLTLYDGTNATFTGGVSGDGGLTKAFDSVGTSTFTQPLNFLGSTILRGGTLRLAEAGRLSTGGVDIRGGALEFNNTDDNAAAGGYLADRISNLAAIELAGGSIVFTENNHTPGNHALGIVRLGGGGLLTITNGSSAPSTVTIGDLIRPRGTLVVNATNLGLTQSPVGNARVFLTQINGTFPTSALIGGGGAVGTTMQSILPWASDVGGSFLTYGTDGLRPLAVSEYDTALGNPPANVRTTAPQFLFAPTTANALLITSGDVTGSQDLTLTSGALTTTAGVNIGANTNTLLTSAGNTRDLVVNNTAGTTALNFKITTSGGVTKTGAGSLTLGATNTFTGGLNIEQGYVNFSKDTTLGAPGGAVRFGGGSSALAALLNYTGSRLTFTRPVETTALGYFTSGAANVRWKIDGAISGAGGVGYFNSVAGQAVFKINAANTYTGPTHWLSGHLYPGTNSAFGNGSEFILQTDGTQNIVLRNVNWTTDRLIHIATGGAIQTGGSAATWSGQLVGTGTLAKNGAGTLTLTEAESWTGALTVNAGAVQLEARGSLAANANDHRVNAGAALLLDNSALTTDRLHDSAGRVILLGGSLHLVGANLIGSGTEEVLNDLTLTTGRASTVTVDAVAAGFAVLRISGGFTVLPGASLFRGTNLGVNAPGTAGSASILLTNATPPLTGGGAPAGHPSIGIIRGAFGDTIANGLGTQLVTYDFDKGVRLLDPNTEYTTTLNNGSAVTDNVKADGASIFLANATTANSLWLSNGGSVSGAGTLTLIAGNLLVTGNANTIANPVTAGANALAVGGPGNVTLNGAVGGGGGLIKQGTGTLTLNAANTYFGTTVLAAGTVALGNAGAFSNTEVQIQGGEIRNNTGGLLTLANNVTLNGALVVTGTQNLTVTGSVLINNAQREINVATSTVTVRLNGPVSANQLLIDYGITKTGPGTLTLNGSQNYDVLTTNGGTTNLNTPLGTGESIINANATTHIGASQTLAELNIGPVAVVTLGSPIPSPAPIGEDWSDPSLDSLAADSPQAVPEPTAMGLLCFATGLLGLRPRRRM